MSCQDCRKPTWKLINPRLAKKAGETLVLKLGNFSKKKIGLGLCQREESPQKHFACQNHRDGEVQIQNEIELQFQKTPYSIDKRVGTVRVEAFGEGRRGCVYKIIGSESESKDKLSFGKVLKIMKAYRKKSKDELININQIEGVGKEIAYFLLESVLAKATSQCSISPLCSFVGIVKLDDFFYFGVELEQFEEDLLKYTKIYKNEMFEYEKLKVSGIKPLKDKLTKATEAQVEVVKLIWDLCLRLGNCGIIWWDIKPGNIVLTTHKSMTSEPKVRFIDFDARYLVYIQGHEAKTLAQMNFILFVNNSDSLYIYRKYILTPFLEANKSLINVQTALMEIAKLNLSIVSSVLNDTYPDGHVSPWLCTSFYGKGAKITQVFQYFLRRLRQIEKSSSLVKQCEALAIKKEVHIPTIYKCTLEMMVTLGVEVSIQFFTLLFKPRENKI